MKIKSNPENGSLTLAMVLVCAAIIVVGVGGCVAYKLQKKVDEANDKKRREMASNEVEHFSQRALQDYVQQSGDSNAFVIKSFTLVPAAENAVMVWHLQSSTDLSNWETILETTNAADADDWVSATLSGSKTSDHQFFRLLSR